DLAQAGRMHLANQLFVKIIHAGLAFVGQLKPAGANAFGNAPAALAIESVKRISDYDMDVLVKLTELVQLFQYVFVIASAEVRGDPMRTIGTFFGTTAAGQHWDGAGQPERLSIRVAKSARLHNVPARKRKRVEIIYRRT